MDIASDHLFDKTLRDLCWLLNMRPRPLTLHMTEDLLLKLIWCQNKGNIQTGTRGGKVNFADLVSENICWDISKSDECP